jgi:hypothetical protein
MVKLGYLALEEGTFIGIKKWWWIFIWKMHAPTNMGIILWPTLEKKMLTWDIGIHRGWVGQNQ